MNVKWFTVKRVWTAHFCSCVVEFDQWCWDQMSSQWDSDHLPKGSEHRSHHTNTTETDWYQWTPPEGISSVLKLMTHTHTVTWHGSCFYNMILQAVIVHETFPINECILLWSFSTVWSLGQLCFFITCEKYLWKWKWTVCVCRLIIWWILLASSIRTFQKSFHDTQWEKILWTLLIRVILLEKHQRLNCFHDN